MIGFSADLDAVELLFTSLLVQASAALQRAGGKRDAAGRSRTRSFRQSFLVAYAVRIGERLSFLGALIEVLQAIPELHRDCDIRDWIADTAAIATAERAEEAAE